MPVKRARASEEDPFIEAYNELFEPSGKPLHQRVALSANQGPELISVPCSLPSLPAVHGEESTSRDSEQGQAGCHVLVTWSSFQPLSHRLNSLQQLAPTDQTKCGLFITTTHPHDAWSRQVNGILWSQALCFKLAWVHSSLHAALVRAAWPAAPRRHRALIFARPSVCAGSIAETLLLFAVGA